MKHEILADETRGVGQTVRKQAGLRVQEESRSADAISANNDNFGELLVNFAFAIVVNSAAG